MMRAAALLSLALAAGITGCRKDKLGPKVEAALAVREKEVDARIAEARRDPASEAPVAKWILPKVLREISGIALTKDGRVLAHNDERGRVYVIDPKRGVVLKEFSIGKKGLVADFEAIAVHGDDYYMLTSNGDVYQFREGADKSEVDYIKHDTKLGKECEFESLVIDPAHGGFIMACKNIGKKSDRNQVLIYRYAPQAGGGHIAGTLSVPLSAVIGGNGWKSFSPSDMAIDPATGNYVIIAGPEKGFVEITPQGSVVRSLPLPGNPQQPEGIAITKDGIMMIGDEGVTRSGDITLYPWRPASAPQAQPDSAAVPAASPTIR
jgi:uncharacterized protein YjiK